MNLGSKIYASLVVAVLLIGGGIFASFHYRTPGYSCVAGPDEQCVSDEDVKDYRRLREIQEKYGMPKDQQLIVNGIIVELRQHVPQGYDFNESKATSAALADRVRYTKQKPATPPPPVSPIPAPPAK